MAKLRAFDVICRMHWAITEPALRQMMLIASRQHDVEAWKALREQKLSPLEGTYTCDVIKGVAVMPVSGPIFRHANLFTEFSGATSLDMLVREFTSLVARDDVEAILMEIDSPGGEAAGINDFGDIVYNARGKKPIYAYTDDLCASAAYWIASATDKIFAAETAALGSIGVIAAMHKPPTAEDDYVEFISSQSPYKRPLYQEDGAGRVQSMVDALGDIFISKVARNRGTDEANVLEHYGNGWVLIGKDAVEAGLADEIATFTEALNATHKAARTAPQPTSEVDAKTAGLPIEIHVNTNADVTPEQIGEAVASQVAAILETTHNGGIESTEVQTVVSEDTTEGGLPMEPVVAETEEKVVSDTPPVADAPAASTTPVVSAEDQQKIRSLETQLAAMHIERHRSDAVNFADIQLAEKRAFPAEREHIISAYVQAATDDRCFGGEVSRVQLLKNAFSARPQHQLTSEQLAPALHEILSRGDTSTLTQGDERPLTTEQLEALIGKTPQGRQALTAIRGGQPVGTVPAPAR